MSRIPLRSNSSLALSNLRAVVILVVIAFHSVLAYVEWIPFRPTSFDDPPYGWRAFPIVDSHRWIGFDIFCAWQDVYLMSLMFLLSGLFVLPSLRRKKGLGFVRDRLRRLGVPYLLGILVLLPLAFYPTYLATGGDPSVTVYLRHYFGLPFLPNGQVWFLWQLLALNFIAASVYWLAPGVLDTSGQVVGGGGPASRRVLCRAACDFRRRLCAAGARIHAVGVVQFRNLLRSVVPAAALLRLLFRRRGHRHRRRSMSALSPSTVNWGGAGSCGWWSRSDRCFFGWA